ncbi:hypothetical protein P171DRAFT_519710 [Karstenula rhodostoma CBS 690.94]|uniref:Ubiquitin-like domain-containing protein n=1 Tax=Karstenula rhodostoma CBS 690.94 TaxID=1392251 RepID=A0A9P4PLC1_9PLEO|nr:hypothetical protein P171DRAFT_519710 [Karstenula rhodostoma CBS 690.94]
MSVGFGWSAGDIAKAISILNRTYKALKETGGAASEYQLLTANLKRYVLVLGTLQDLRPEGLDRASLNALTALASSAGALLIKFEQNELCKYESTLGSRKEKSRLSGFAKKTRYTFDLPKKVEKLLQNLGMFIDQIIVLLSVCVLKHGESIGKQCDLIKAQIETGQPEQKDMQKEQSKLCVQLNAKLLKLVDVVSAQTSKLQIIQNIQSEMRRHVHEQAESQARQEDTLEDLTAAINNIQIDQDEVRRNMGRQGAELSKQRQTLKQLGADLANVSQHRTAYGVSVAPAAGSASMTEPNAPIDPISSDSSGIRRGHSCTCATNTTQDAEEGDADQRQNCSIHSQGIVVSGPRLPLEQEHLILLREIGLQLCRLLLESTVKLIALARYFISISPQLLVTISHIWRIFPTTSRMSLQDLILFEDVLGRVHRLPYEYFRHWDHFQVQLKILFRNESEGLLIEQDLFHIIDDRGRIIGKQSSKWNRSIYPGQRIAMSAIMFRSTAVTAGQCPRCGSTTTQTHASRSFCEGCSWESYTSTSSQAVPSWEITNRGESIYKRTHFIEQPIRTPTFERWMRTYTPKPLPETSWFCSNCGDGSTSRAGL